MARASNTSGNSKPYSSIEYANSNILTGKLPEDFLRLSGDNAALTTQVQYPAFKGFQKAGGLLTVTIVQARLAKNYGVTKMDPFCRLRIGDQVFETPTAYNGATSPKWNKCIQCHITENTKEIYLEFFDERTFSIDKKIAWGLIQIKNEVFTSGEAVDSWYSLNGKQGNEKEGMVQILLQYRKSEGAPVLIGGPVIMNPVAATQMVYGYPPMMYAPPMMIPQMTTQQQITQPQQQQPSQQQQQIPEVNQKDLNALKEICPSLDEEIIKTVLQQSGGNVDRAAGQLLEMSAS